MSKKNPLTLSFPRGESLPVWAFVFSGLIATLMGVSAIMMMTTVYELQVDYIGNTFFIAIIGFGFSYIHARKDIRLNLIALGSALLVTVLPLVFDIMQTRYAAGYFFSTVQKSSLYFLPGGGDYIVENAFAMGIFMSLLSIFPTYILTWVIMRKKNIVFALLGYLPFVLLTFALNYKGPTTGSSIVFISCILMLFIFRNVRKSAKEKTYRDLLLILVPLMIILCIISFLYPQKKYRQDELAQKQYLAMQRLIDRISKALPWGTGKQVQNEKRQNIAITYNGSVIIDSYADNALRMNVGTENLMMAGNFNPPKVKFMTVVREKNDLYSSNAPEGNHYLYIKTSSMSRYDGYSWYAAAADLTLPDYYPSGDISEQEAQYLLRIRLSFLGDYAFVPYYTDHYHLDPRSDIYVKPPYLTTKESYNMNEKTAIEKPVQEYYYAYSDVPVRVAPKWSDDYIAQIYKDCLYVPEQTKNSIVLSGMLPQWYLDLLTGVEDWPTEQKVKAIIRYVSTLKDYDANTRFPPDDTTDFVSWFMRNSRTGFCVHYASTAVILLRMVNVPARYVNGYLLTDVQDGVNCDVYTTDAHAWIEYFHHDYGWIMDDPTPGNETAASYYNFDAIIREYGPETTMVTPIPMPSNTPTPTPAFGNSILHPGEKGDSNIDNSSEFNRLIDSIVRHLLAILIRVGIVALVLAALIFGVRAVFQTYWFRRFRQDSANLSARAYYRYYVTLAKILEGEPSGPGSDIAGKATFSREGITSEELSAMIEAEEKNLTKIYAEASDRRKNLYDILRIRKKLPLY